MAQHRVTGGGGGGGGVGGGGGGVSRRICCWCAGRRGHQLTVTPRLVTVPALASSAASSQPAREDSKAVNEISRNFIFYVLKAPTSAFVS